MTEEANGPILKRNLAQHWGCVQFLKENFKISGFSNGTETYFGILR